MFTPLNLAKISVKNTPLKVENLTYNDIYFSVEDPISESNYIYIDANNLPVRFKQCQSSYFTVGELGFGSGLNLYLTIRSFLENRGPALKKLFYISTELNPISKIDLAKIYQVWSHLEGFKRFSDSLLDQYPPALSGIYQISIHPDVELILLLGDSRESLKTYLASIDVWFLDGFSPNKNPEQWSLSLCNEIARLSKAGTTLSAFSCARSVQSGLESIGATLAKRKGFGKKREMLTAKFINKPSFDTYIKFLPQWAAFPSPNPKPKSITIIGAGLASALTALTFSELGIKVTVITDKANFDDILPSAALHLHLSTENNLKRSIDLVAYKVATQFYKYYDPDFSVGLHEFDSTTRQQKLKTSPTHQLAFEIDEHTGATHYYNSGKVDPNRLIKHCFSNKNISVLLSHKVISIQREDLSVKCDTPSGEKNIAFENLILSMGAKTQELLTIVRHCSKPIRGQLSLFETTLQQPNYVQCHKTLQVPVSKNHYYAGGTYDLTHPFPDIKEKDNKKNLAAVVSHNDNHRNDKLISAWAGVRMTSNDTLPFISPVPMISSYVKEYHHLKHHATKPVTQPAQYDSNIYINTAYGSKGLLYAPIAAKALAHYLVGTPAPLMANQLAGVHLGRFIIRHMKRRTVDTLFN